jgi:hypothetical protein
MADNSAVAACRTKYLALTAANFPSSTRPNVYFDEVPAKDGGGNAQRPPFVVIKDNGTTPSYEFERSARETTEIDFEVYAAELGDVDTIVNAIRYNGGSVSAGSGFDFGTFSGLASGLTTHEIKRVREQRFQAGFGVSGQLIHGCRLSYRVTLLRQ